MSIKEAFSYKILIICIIVLLVINIYLTAQGLKRLKSCQNPNESLPCQALPMRFVMDEPECADKLINSMNLTNVRILSVKNLSYLQSKSTFNFQNISQGD